MIIKSFEVNKINLDKNKFFLIYGDNQGAKNELINLIIKEKKDNIHRYFENEVISNEESFFNSISSKSFFEKERIIIIKNISNKILKIFETIIEKKYSDITIVLDSEGLEKKSKLRTIFEKGSNLICVPFYPDNQKTLNIIANKFLIDNKINLSQECVNLIVERANGSREHLYIELQKIKNFSITKKTISLEDVIKITNLGNEYKISELVDYCLANNKTKVVKFINENNLNNEDSILMIRIFLAKAKRLLKLNKSFKLNNNLENIISTFKPPIFWKEKDLVKSQMKIWSYEKNLQLINRINKIEYLIKKTPELSVYIINNFIFTNLQKTNN